MGASFSSLSAVTASWMVACPWALVRGGLGGSAMSQVCVGVWAWLAATLLQTRTQSSPPWGSWMGLQGEPSRGLVVGAGAGSWSAAAGGAQAVSFTSTG